MRLRYNIYKKLNEIRMLYKYLIQSKSIITEMDSNYINITVKSVNNVKTATFPIWKYLDYDDFVNEFTTKLKGEFDSIVGSNYELVNADSAYHSHYIGAPEEAPYITMQNLYDVFMSHTHDYDISLYIRSASANNLANSSVDSSANIIPVTPQQQAYARYIYGIDTTVAVTPSTTFLSNNPSAVNVVRNNCECCNRSVQSYNYFGCTHVFCNNCIQIIRSNHYSYCAFCYGLHGLSRL